MAELDEKTATEVVDDPVEVRRAKREALLANGPDPYARRFDVTDKAAELEGRYAALEAGQDTGDVVRVAGRVMAVRNQGKVLFIVIRDATGDLQLFIRINVLGEEGFALAADLDMGDWIGAEGTVVRTRRGQLSVAPTQVTLLTKALRPLPEKFHGLQDKETRYRQRYVDLIVNEDSKRVLASRSKIVSAVRHCLEDEGYMEVETPLLHPIPGGATAKPFITHHNALNHDFYLRVAPELYLKRLLVGGFERVFELGRSFRNEGMDLTHNPEFTTMEAYCAYTDLEGMKELCQKVFCAAALAAAGTLQVEFDGNLVDLSGTWPSRPMSELVSEALGEEVCIDTPIERLRELATAHGIEVKPEWGEGKLIGELYDELVEETIVQPTFVTDHPLEVSPLAKKKLGAPKLTDRFELVICGHEYANAFSELNDPVDQAERFRAQVAAKELGDDEAMGYDADYVRALEYGMPPAGGIGIGIDRLCMLVTGATSIRDVLLFPTMRPEAGIASSAPETVAAEKPAEAPAAPDFSNVVVEPLFEDLVDFETFSRSDFRVVKVKACEAVPKSKKLLKFTLDDGSGTDRVILSGISAYYEPDQLVGKTAVAIVNLPPRSMMGIDSCGMLISAIHEEEGAERLNLLMLDDRIPAGAKLY